MSDVKLLWCVAVPAEEQALGVGLSLGKAVGLFSSTNACRPTVRFAVIGRGISVDHSLKHDLFPSSRNSDQLLDHEKCYY